MALGIVRTLSVSIFVFVALFVIGAKANLHFVNGTGQTIPSDHQEVITKIPVSEEMRSLIRKISPYSFHLSEKLRMLLERFESGKDTFVRVHAKHPSQFASFEAQWEPYGEYIRLRNISIYVWDDFFKLPKINLENPHGDSQLKVLLKQFLHVLIAFPDLKMERLTDLVLRLGSNSVNVSLINEIDRELSQSNHILVDQCISEYGNCEKYFRLRFFQTLDQLPSDFWGAKIHSFPSNWIEALKGAEKDLSERIVANADLVWANGPSDIYDSYELRKNKDFYLFARSSIPSIWGKVLTFLKNPSYGIKWVEHLTDICQPQFEQAHTKLYSLLQGKNFYLNAPFYIDQTTGGPQLIIKDLTLSHSDMSYIIPKSLGFECQLDEEKLKIVYPLLEAMKSYAILPTGEFVSEDKVKFNLILKHESEDVESSVWKMLEREAPGNSNICSFLCKRMIYYEDSEGYKHFSHYLYWMGRGNVFLKDRRTADWLLSKGVDSPQDLDWSDSFSFDKINAATKLHFRGSDRSVIISIFDLADLITEKEVSIDVSKVKFVYEPVWVGQ